MFGNVSLIFAGPFLCTYYSFQTSRIIESNQSNSPQSTGHQQHNCLTSAHILTERTHDSCSGALFSNMAIAAIAELVKFDQVRKA